MQGCPDYAKLGLLIYESMVHNGKEPTQSQIAEIYDVDRKTIGRWYKKARKSKRIQKKLMSLLPHKTHL